MYPRMRPLDHSYDEYWATRDVQASLNAFQRDRAEIILQHVNDRDSVVDIGCGDGRILEFLTSSNSTLSVQGIDNSPAALDIARRRGLRVKQCDITQLHAADIPEADWILLLEVLEHITTCEEVLCRSLSRCKKGVIFSVPNTGFIVHRLRLLLGRFPLQWRAHPGEHVRFWTLTDMHFWLKAQGYRYSMYAYQGVPLLWKLWPSLFAAGLCVKVFSHDDA